MPIAGSGPVRAGEPQPDPFAFDEVQISETIIVLKSVYVVFQYVNQVSTCGHRLRRRSLRLQDTI